MSTGKKIMALCERNGIKISKLESELGFSRGSLTKNDPNAMRSDRNRIIAEYFNVTPTYLITDMVYCVCPVCAGAYDPLKSEDIELHKNTHNNYIELRSKMGYLLNPSQAATKRSIAQSLLEQGNLPDDGKIFNYETLVQCDFAEYAFFNNFQIDISYSDFIKDEIREKKYFDLIPLSVVKNLMSKYNVDPDEEGIGSVDSLQELFKKDEEFMRNISDLWDLPQQLRYDVYKAIRHAKRDYADKEYYTNPYANISNTCYDYDSTSEKCQNCEKGIKHDN